jgi:hypothetical protein
MSALLGRDGFVRSEFQALSVWISGMRRVALYLHCAAIQMLNSILRFVDFVGITSRRI